jgi:hypothetical protein
MLHISVLVTLAIAKDARADGMTAEECPTTMTSRIKEEPVRGRAENRTCESRRDNRPRASCRRTILIDHGFLVPALVDRDLLEVDGWVPRHPVALELSRLK